MRLVYALGILAGLASFLAGLEWWTRRRNYYYGPNRVEHLRAWHKTAPHIPPANLPATRELKAKPVKEPINRVARFVARSRQGRHL